MKASGELSKTAGRYPLSANNCTKKEKHNNMRKCAAAGKCKYRLNDQDVEGDNSLAFNRNSNWTRAQGGKYANVSDRDEMRRARPTGKRRSGSRRSGSRGSGAVRPVVDSDEDNDDDF